jgi:capsular polysaccharide export protein
MNERIGEVGVFSRGIARIPALLELLGAERLRFRPSARTATQLSAVIGWGHKATASAARDYAERHRLPYLALEDGFLRSIGLGTNEPTLSLVVDDLGIYYDARQPSRLEHVLESDPRLEDLELLERATRFRERWVSSGVSKYNHAPDELPAALGDDSELVLVADQTFDDASVTGALADASTFDRALECALDEHPDARVVVKVHPATVAGKKRGYLAGRTLPARVTVVSANVNPQALLRRTRHLYVCSSQLGFEGLLAGVKVTCFGQAFYSGWGLTDDRSARRAERRTRKLALSQLVAGALLLYPRYRSPLRAERCEPEQVLEHLALQRRMFAENRRHFVCFDMSYWKRPFVRRYLSAPGHVVRFAKRPADLDHVDDPTQLTAVVWASRKTPALARWAETRGVPLWHMEDGFLRSAGLGSDLTAPGSLVLDPDGIYYDPSRPSRLERILQETRFDRDELERARRLRQLIVQSRISKYNLPARSALNLGARSGQRILLVPGQVADDASVRLGAGSVADNLALLRAVRGENPDAYVIYKPHPDVLSGNRKGALHDIEAPPWDLLIGQVPLASCLDVANEVHTLTSLVGFEALLRGLPVVTYGQPFYAGWGLTRDHAPHPRRSRRLELDELVAGTLLAYPRYVNWSARCFVSAEDKVRELEQASRAGFRNVPLPRLALKVRSLVRSGLEWWQGRELRRD